MPSLSFVAIVTQGRRKIDMVNALVQGNCIKKPVFQAFEPDSATRAFINMFAGGAILVMLADTMIPEAFGHGGKLAGLVLRGRRIGRLSM